MPNGTCDLRALRRTANIHCHTKKASGNDVVSPSLFVLSSKWFHSEVEDMEVCKSVCLAMWQLQVVVCKRTHCV